MKAAAEQMKHGEPVGKKMDLIAPALGRAYWYLVTFKENQGEKRVSRE